MAKKSKLSPEERERREIVERYFEKVKRKLEDRIIARAQAEEEAEKEKSA